MNKVIFTYKKDDGTQSERKLLRASFLKEASNHIKDFEKESVKYVKGYEIDGKDLTPEQIQEYEDALKDYFDLAIPTMEEFFREEGLDVKRLQEKTFKKEGISDLKILGE